eukprot:TRINITY_DN20255_c0_g1_i2.p1 TRINITY_DN20255_c0_g1~~TRINITY_DN20255_c0_g1_i2.p1  ORF type:complete len:563 (+),score=170.87 TRINITY_DN20255_c0_g1_i2:199-1887(+)
MDDLDEELLALHGGQKRQSSIQQNQSKKKRRMNSDSDSASASEEDSPSSSEDEQDEPAPAKGRLQKKQQEASPMQEEDDSDNDDMDELDKYDEEGYGDEADRERLYAMNDIEREQELAERVEQRRQLQQRLNLRRKVSQKQSQAQAKADRDTRRAAGSSARDNRKAALDDLRRRKSGEFTKKKKRPVYDEEEESEQESEEEGERSEYESAEEEYEQTRQWQELEWPELKAMIPDLFLKRTILEEWQDKPYFKESVVGTFVKVNIGISKQTGQPTYRLCRVTGVKETTRKYKLSSGLWSNLHLVLSFGADAKGFPMSVTSNEPPDEKLMEKWKAKCEHDNVDLPAKEDIERTQDLIQNANNFVYDNTVIDKIVAGGDVTKQGNIAIQKERLKWLREGAAADGNNEEYAKYSEQLDQLLEQEHQIKSVISEKEKVASGVTHVNARSRDINRQMEAAIGARNRESRNNAEDDFVRRPTRNLEYFDLGQDEQKADSPRAAPKIAKKAVEEVKKTLIEQVHELVLEIDVEKLKAAKPCFSCPRPIRQRGAKSYSKTLSLDEYLGLVE